MTEFKISAKVWVYQSLAASHFVTLPKKDATIIAKYFSVFSRRWSSIPVMVKLKQTIWYTSIFKDRKTESFLLPIKKEIRIKENIN